MGQAFENIIMTHDDGIVELRIHHRGGSAKWALWGGLHKELGIAFAHIAADPDARVLLITGTGDTFCAEFDMDCDMPQMGGASWDVIFREGRALLNNLLAIEIPVVAAVNGPAFIHAEIALLADVVLAAEGAAFADKPHALAGVVPGDGVHSIWPMLLGPNRGRYFLMTGQEIGAQEALTLGLVGEILSPDVLMPRARELARTIAARPAVANRYTRILLTRDIRARLATELDQGLAMEGMAILAAMQGQA
ncbi:enoyl-CoA hydratase [Sphingobium chungbukense]|uniref:Enoyl-CoA hydratase n=2 Tax=Sphingobium chungbukense TaxID=56193 RepID=A0A0M3ASL4_9SPHN|nr:enoyl-CoA hydratase [Sphingobium chungbukense]